MVNARESHGNSYGVFISPEGCGTLAGGKTPGYRAVTLRPGRALESTIACPIRFISPIRPIPSRHPGCEPLIRVEHSLKSPLSPTRHKPIIRLENKGIKPKSNRHKPKYFPRLVVVCTMAVTQRAGACRAVAPRRWVASHRYLLPLN